MTNTLNGIDVLEALAMNLYHLLAEMDPSKWQKDCESALRVRLKHFDQQLAEAMQKLEERFAQMRQAKDKRAAAMVPLKDRLLELRHLIREHTPNPGLKADELRRQFMTLRQRMHPAYENLAHNLKAMKITLPALRPTNYSRSLFHILNAFVAILVIEVLLTPFWVFVVASTWFLLAWTLEYLRIGRPVLNDKLMKLFGPIAHPHEWHRINSATWYCTALIIIALPQKSWVSACAMAVLGVGDPCAGWIGRRYGKIKLLHGRTLEGSLGFIVCGFALAFGVLAIWHADMGLGIRFILAGTAAILGAVAEMFSRRIDDNLSIPVAAAAGTLLVGWLLGVF